MQSKALEAHFASRSRKSASSLDQIARALRAEGLLPSGARGRHAPRLNAEQMANFLIAACMASSPATAVETVQGFARLLPANDISKEQLALFHQFGVKKSEINFQKYLGLIFWAGWNNSQKHIEEIVFEILPVNPEIISPFKVTIRSKTSPEWMNYFGSRESSKDHLTSFLLHREVRSAFVLETVSLQRHFLHGLFMESNAAT